MNGLLLIQRNNGLENNLNKRIRTRKKLRTFAAFSESDLSSYFIDLFQGQRCCNLFPGIVLSAVAHLPVPP